MVEVKICGIKDLAAMEAALDARADLVGLVFFPPSPRAVTPTAAMKLADKARNRALITALLVDGDDDLIAEIISCVKPDLLQLHGSETPERVNAIRTRVGKPVMKAIAVSTAEDLRALPAFETVADRILFDAKPPQNATRTGGYGLKFDWRLLANVSRKKPIMLSGGLKPENVEEAIRIVRPDGVDVSSGVERVLGEKDSEKIKTFVANARAAAKNISPEKVS
jgi:phosphoribosylanthranilate isomerase